MIYLKNRSKDSQQCGACLRFGRTQEIRHMEDTANRRIAILCDDCLDELLKTLKRVDGEAMEK